MATTNPNLGYGKQTEATIDQVNIWMRGQPWYQQQMKAWGQDPGHPTLNKSQSQQILKQAQAQGVVVDQGNMEVDDHGNFNPIGHKLRNTLIVAGLAAATIATMGAAGAFSGAAGSSAAAASAGTGAAAAGAGAAAAGAGVGAGVAGAAGTAGTLGTLAGIGHFIAPAVPAMVGAFSNIYSANKMADASRYGVDAQTAAANHAADLQDEAAKRAELFARQQAETGWQGSEHTQQANYNQWASTQHAIMDSLGTQLGIKYTMPDYTPGVDPHYLDGTTPPPTGAGPTSTAGPTTPSTTPGPAGPAPSVDPSKGDLTSQISAYFKSRGVSDQETPYWVGKWSELEARGKELNDPTYANKRLAAADVFGGQSKTTVPTTAASPTLATFASPNFMKFQPAMALPMSYQPNTLGAYVGRP